MKMLSKVKKYDLIRPIWETLLRLYAVFSLQCHVHSRDNVYPTQKPHCWHWTIVYEVQRFNIYWGTGQSSCCSKTYKISLSLLPSETFPLFPNSVFPNRFKYLQINPQWNFKKIILSATILPLMESSTVYCYKRKNTGRNYKLVFQELFGHRLYHLNSSITN